METDARFDEIERQIEMLQARLDTYRQALQLSRAAIWVSGIVLLLALTIAGTYRTPIVIFGSMTVLLAGTIWFGATTTSRAEAESALADAEAKKARLFDEVAARNGWPDMTATVH